MRRKNQIKYFVGVDEVGRGPLAGPVAVGAAAIVNPKSKARNPKFRFHREPSTKSGQNQNLKILKNIRDSKKLSAKKREEWAEKIVCAKSGIKTAVCFVGNGVIDKKGIVKAIGIAVKRALKKLEREAGISPKNCFVLLDGSLKAPSEYNQKTIIKGDEKIPVISAASIIAKVARDRKMVRFHKKFPHYALDRHKGYGTKLHYKMIKKRGICEIHRKSFLPARLASGVLRARKKRG